MFPRLVCDLLRLQHVIDVQKRRNKHKSYGTGWSLEKHHACVDWSLITSELPWQHLGMHFRLQGEDRILTYCLASHSCQDGIHHSKSLDRQLSMGGGQEEGDGKVDTLFFLFAMSSFLKVKGGREGRKRQREGGLEGGREQRREGGREGGRKRRGFYFFSPLVFCLQYKTLRCH